MNEFGISLIWLAGQVTLLCGATAVIYLIARRRHPAAGAVAALMGLLLSAVLTLGLFSPWPRWSLSRAAEPVVTAMPTQPSGVTSAAANDALPLPAVGSDAGPLPEVALESSSAAAWTTFWQSIGRELAEPAPPRAEAGYRWTGWLAVAILLAMAFGALRLVVGWLTVRRCLQRSTLLGDRTLLETLDILRAELGCRRGVELRESGDVASAATVGWRKPVILLPRGWRNWSDTERRAVLAHELAHVTAGDAATWLAAQFGLLLHFYHPLVHWLTHRLRLEQELAADALAARLTGSSHTYLTTLAGLAVRQPDRPAPGFIGAWPARAFLPTPGTLLRRIEMLRDTKAPPLRSSTLRRGTVIALTLAAGIFVAGLRPPQSQQATAQEPAKPQAAEKSSGFNLENIPASTIAFLGIRPAQLVERPEIRPLATFIEEALQSEKTGIYAKDIDQVLIGIVRGHDPNANPAFGSVRQNPPAEPAPAQLVEIRMQKPTDFDKYIKYLQSSELMYDEVIEQIGVEKPRGRRSVLALAGKSNGVEINPKAQVAFRVDDRTLLLGQSLELADMLNAKRTKQNPDWIDRFRSVAVHDEVCTVWNMAALRPIIQQQFEQKPNPFVGMFVPLWQKTDLVIGGAKVDDRLTLTINGWAPDADAAAKLEKTLTSLVPFATGLLESAKASAKQGPPEMQAAMQQLLGFAGQALDNFKVQTTDDRITVTVEGDAGSVAATFAAVMLPALKQAREAARRTQSKNNLKRIGLAFHIYHDKSGHFPPPVLYGRGANGQSKYPHSWRVAILPFVDAAPLYDQYHFDEPWDSEHNKSIMEQMPAVFRSPNDDTSSTNAAYYVLVGENTAVGEVPASTGQPTTGNAIPTFTDGTSNTLLVVEAKRDIPWTKPEDIPYSADAELPEFGGFHMSGFLTSLADGSVRFISENIDEKTLRALITRDGSEVILDL